LNLENGQLTLVYDDDISYDIYGFTLGGQVKMSQSGRYIISIDDYGEVMRAIDLEDENKIFDLFKGQNISSYDASL